MILSEAYRLMSHRARRGAAWAFVMRVAVALLEMVGVAALIGIMLVVLGGSGETGVAGSASATGAAGAVGSASATGSAGSSISAATTHLQQWLGVEGTSFTVLVCVALLVIFVVKSVAVIALNRAQSRSMQHLFEELSAEMFSRYLHSGLLYIRSHNSAEIINNTTAVCARFADGVVGVMLSLAGEMAMLTMIIVALAIYDPIILLLAVAVFIPFTASYALFFRRRMVRDGREENIAAVHQNKLMSEALREYSDVEIYGAQSSVSRRFSEGLRKLARLRLRNATIRGASSAVVEFSLVAGVVVMVVVGLAMGRDIAALRISLGIFAVAAYKIAPSVSKIVNGFTELHRNKFAIERLKSNYELQITDYGLQKPLKFERSIELRNVFFTYPNGKEVLNNINLTIQRGERLGISGASGIGKTTLLNILCGLFDPTAGEVLVDGIQIDEQNRRSWQANLAYVSQDVFLPDCSIAENVAFGIFQQDIDTERVNRALKAAALDEFVASLPNGIDTITGEAGARISGGQRQRIGIARALYKGASALLFDEATSSLDKTTENAIIDTISSLSPDLTIVIISHNERTLKLCNRTVTL